jgi:hypothetical protein
VDALREHNETLKADGETLKGQLAAARRIRKPRRRKRRSPSSQPSPSGSAAIAEERARPWWRLVG